MGKEKIMAVIAGTTMRCKKQKSESFAVAIEGFSFTGNINTVTAEHKVKCMLMR
jgi:hypothetical protein